jgi:hypothetical protein
MVSTEHIQHRRLNAKRGSVRIRRTKNGMRNELARGGEVVRVAQPFGKSPGAVTFYFGQMGEKQPVNELN